MSGLSRDVLKWLQSLDLTWQVKSSKWNLTNGYIIAEIFSWYFPQEVQMHMFNNGTSLDFKVRNWSLLKNFIKRHNLEIAEDYIEGTIHCKEGAGQLLIERIYEILTNRDSIQSPFQPEIDFTDRAYQVLLPLHARSTASQAVKNNVRITELMADKNIILGQQKAQSIISDHLDHRRQERQDDPERFSRHATLGEMAIRREPPQSENTQYSEDMTRENTQQELTEETTQEERQPDIPYREITVKQLAKSETPQIPGY